MNVEIAVTQLPHGEHLELPYYATLGAAGMDLQAAIAEPVILGPGKRCVIGTGITIELPQNFEAQIRPRSGLAAKHGVTVLNSPGTIDSDYRGEIGVILINHGEEDFTIEPGMRIAQMVIAQHATVDWKVLHSLTETIRGQRGFGSTGTNR